MKVVDFLFVSLGLVRRGGASFEESACVGWSGARVKTETPRSAKRGTALLIQTLGAVAYASAGASVASSAAGAPFALKGYLRETQAFIGSGKHKNKQRS